MSAVLSCSMLQNPPDLFSYFNEIIDILLQEVHTQKYAATAWTCVFWHEDVHPEYRTFIINLVNGIIDGHARAERPNFKHEESGKEFSPYAYTVGETFIQMMLLNSDLYTVLADIFEIVIRTEMRRDLEKGKIDAIKKDTGHENPRMLFDDIIDFISERGKLRSDDSLKGLAEQKNPNEYMLILAERMRTTRQYIIQDIADRQALKK